MAWRSRIPLGIICRRCSSDCLEADVAVIGSGAGGYVAAIKSAQSGLKVGNNHLKFITILRLVLLLDLLFAREILSKVLVDNYKII